MAKFDPFIDSSNEPIFGKTRERSQFEKMGEYQPPAEDRERLRIATELAKATLSPVKPATREAEKPVDKHAGKPREIVIKAPENQYSSTPIRGHMPDDQSIDGLLRPYGLTQPVTLAQLARSHADKMIRIRDNQQERKLRQNYTLLVDLILKQMIG